MGATLCLAISPLLAGEAVVAVPCKVHFQVVAPNQPLPGRFQTGDPSWQAVQGEGDFRPTNRFLNGLLEARVDGQLLPDFLVHDDASMWQFLPSFIWPEVYRAVELVRLLVPLFQTHRPARVRVELADDALATVWRGAVQAVAGTFDVPVSRLPVAGRRSLARQAARRLGLPRLIQALWDFRLRRGLRRLPPSPPATGRRLLFATLARHWVPDPLTPGRSYDEQIFPLLPALREDGWSSFLGIDCPYNPVPVTLASLAQRIREAPSDVSWQCFPAHGGRGASFQRQWQALRRDAGFARAFAYEGVPLWPALEGTLAHAFAHILPMCARTRGAARRLLERERPAALLLTYETGHLQRSLVIEASRLGIPTVGLMHGMIYDNHYDYMHARVTTRATERGGAFVVPLTTCVWGPMWQRNLTEAGHYPASAVTVTGNWRNERILAQVAATSREALRASFGVAPAAEVVLILSAGYDAVRFVETCLDAITSQPLIKLHPTDDPAPVEALLASRGLPPETLLRGRLLEALAIADAVVAQPSTSVSEALLLDRPVVLANLQQLGGWNVWTDAGVCLEVHDGPALAEALTRALADGPTREALAAARAGFVRDQFYVLDGGAARRVAGALAAVGGGG